MLPDTALLLGGSWVGVMTAQYMIVWWFPCCTSKSQENLWFSAVSVKELNDRIDYQVEIYESGGTRFLPHNLIANEGVPYKTSPYNLKIKMVGSGLYHFQTRVPSHMSYCDLTTEFVVSFTSLIPSLIAKYVTRRSSTVKFKRQILIL